MSKDQLVYIVFGCIISLALVLDLGFLSKKNTIVSVGQALKQTFLWVLLALGFFIFVWIEEGQKIDSNFFFSAQMILIFVNTYRNVQSPLLFRIFINDQPKNIKKICKLYADDMTVS